MGGLGDWRLGDCGIEIRSAPAILLCESLRLCDSASEVFLMGGVRDSASEVFLMEGVRDGEEV